ncbi:MAG: glycosyltransferase family 1 protein, partial [Phycisphaerales bacterium]|nr:glycosyltransferase family 1 protein [Phycisphaerales bacterium]
MRILFASIGTAGDVLPLIGVARDVATLGHEVAMVLTPEMRPIAHRAGIACFSLLSECLPSRPPAAMFHAQKAPFAIWDLLVPRLPDMAVRGADAIREFTPDLVGTHCFALGMRWACERLEVPTVNIVLSPQAFFHPRDRTIYIPETTTPPPCPALQVRMVRKLLAWRTDRRLNEVRDHLGMATRREVFFRETTTGPCLALWSACFRPALDGDPGRTCGFDWYDDDDVEGPPDPGLDRFLEQGRPPVIATFGTSAAQFPPDHVGDLIRAARHIGRRVLLVMPNVPSFDANDVHHVRSAPYGLLLHRGCLTIHHGGIGTTARAMRSGRPMIVIPHLFDQFDNAHRVRALGV